MSRAGIAGTTARRAQQRSARRQSRTGSAPPERDDVNDHPRLICVSPTQRRPGAVVLDRAARRASNAWQRGFATQIHTPTTGTASAGSRNDPSQHGSASPRCVLAPGPARPPSRRAQSCRDGVRRVADVRLRVGIARRCSARISLTSRRRRARLSASHGNAGMFDSGTTSRGLFRCARLRQSSE